MSAEKQFWLNWLINLAVAIGTLGAVVVALFGDALRKKLFPPLLSLQLVRTEGEKTTVLLVTTFVEGAPKERKEDARYYHIQLSNQRRWSPANQVQVILTRLEEPGPDGDLQIIWSGDVPIRWRHQEIYPASRTIGPAADCDLCSVVKNKWLQLHPLLVPFNLDVLKRDKANIVVSLQARSNESDSQIIRVQISWDGEWEDGDQEMKRHLIVKVLD